MEQWDNDEFTLHREMNHHGRDCIGSEEMDKRQVW